MPERAAYAHVQRIADRRWRAPRPAACAGSRRTCAGCVGPDADRRRRCDALARAGMRSYLRYWCDAFRLPRWRRERIVGRVRHRTTPTCSPTRSPSGRGVVVALPHMGNWDHAGAWASVAHRQTVHTVAERLEPEVALRAVPRLPRALGMEVLPLTGGDAPFPILLRRLRAGALVALLGDRDLTATGHRRSTSSAPRRACPAGPAALAVQTGAALMAVDALARGRAQPRAVPPADRRAVGGPEASAHRGRHAGVADGSPPGSRAARGLAHAAAALGRGPRPGEGRRGGR